MDTCAPLRITESSFDLGRAPKLCNLAVLNYAGMVEAEAMLGRYYYMVIHPHIYRVESLYDIARHFDILTAGRRISAGVIVYQNNIYCLAFECLEKNFPGRYERSIDRAHGQLLFCQQHASRIQHHHSALLPLLVPQILHIEIRDAGGRRCRMQSFLQLY